MWLDCGLGAVCVRHDACKSQLCVVRDACGVEAHPTNTQHTLQACTNTIMAHFVGMLFSNWLLTVVNKFK